MSHALRLVLGGSAKVFCVHDREKRVVTDPEHVRFLGSVLGLEYDARRHKLQLCACCQNLFPTFDDTPQLCAPCRGRNVHTLAASVPDPIEGAI